MGVCLWPMCRGPAAAVVTTKKSGALGRLVTQWASDGATGNYLLLQRTGSLLGKWGEIVLVVVCGVLLGAAVSVMVVVPLFFFCPSE